MVDPAIDDKLRLVDLANDLGIDTMDIGLPGAGKRAVEDVTVIAEHIRDGKLRVKASCAARTHQADIQAIVDISQKVGIEIEVLFLAARGSGSTPMTGTTRRLQLSRPIASAAGTTSRRVLHRGRHAISARYPDICSPAPSTRRSAADRLCTNPSASHSDGIPIAPVHSQRTRRNGRSDFGITGTATTSRPRLVNSIFAIE